jgi:myo-inositol-1(or 4)-monophosphatase
MNPFDSPIQHPMLETALRAATLASQVLRDRFRTQVQVEAKRLANFVTEVDLLSEQLIVQTIRESFPDHAIISEESNAEQAAAPELWIVDPMDGTSNFMHGIPHFAVSIGYYQQGQAELGVVCNPITNDWYVAALGQGAWYNGARQAVTTAKRIDECMIVCGFYYDRGAMMQATLDTVGDFFRRNIHGMRRFGAAALDLCNVGCGQYGVFFEYKLHPWDYAAGQLFVVEAGGRSTDCNQLPLPLDRASSICTTNGFLHPQAMEIIEPHWRRLSSPLS